MTNPSLQDLGSLCAELRRPENMREFCGVTGPYDAALCPICFDQDSTGCVACDGTGKRKRAEERLDVRS